MKKTKAVVVYSGGMDSFTVLNMALNMGREVFPINFNYGQKHDIETKYARDVCQMHELPLQQIDITSLNQLIDNSALTGNIEVPKGHYEDETMKATVVPNRNMMLLSMAAAYAINIGATEVWYGAHSGDHAIYPDCRPEFVWAMKTAFSVCDYEDIELVVPFLDSDKEGILQYGIAHGLNYETTWTCYDPQTVDGDSINPQPKVLACGKCGSCQERLEAFAKVEKVDPLEYV